MITRHFPIFILQCALVFAFFSCDRKSAAEAVLPQYGSYIEKGEGYAKRQQYDSAYYYFNQAKLAATGAKTSDQMVYALIRMAFIQQVQSDFSGSETTATEAVRHLNDCTVAAYPAILYNTLGNSYDQLYDYSHALQYYNASSRLTADPLNRCIILNNIAYVYMEQQDYRSAIKILGPLSKNAALQKDSISYVKILDNLGYSYFRSGFRESLAYLDAALKIRTKANDDFELISSYLHLSEYYASTNKEVSRKFAWQAYVSATKVNSVDDRIATLKNLIALNSGDIAKKYALVHLHLIDSIGRVRQKAKNQFAKIRYDDAKTRAENATLKYEKEKMSLYAVILLAISLILTLLVFLIRFRKRVSHEREKIEAAHQAEIRIGNKIHDELANDLYNTMMFTETQDFAEPSKKETLLRHLDSVYSRARDISRENTEIATDSAFPLQLRGMLNEYNTDLHNVIVRGLEGFPWGSLSKAKKVIVYRVLQEWMVNMTKHSKAKFAVLQFESDAKYTTVRYSDNGVGIDMKGKFSKNGLRNVENRIRLIGGTVTFEPEPGNGLQMAICFPTAN